MTKSDSSASRRGAVGRPREFDIDAALDAATIVFRERGYGAASLSELGAAMKLTAGSIYKAFADKRAIFLAAFDRYVRWRGGQMRPLLDAAPTGRAKIAAMLRYYAETSHGVEGARGCLVAGGAMEIATYDAGMAERITSGLRDVADRVRGLILLGRSDGSIAPDIDVDATADVLVAVLQGFRVIGKTGPDRARMIASAERALRLLD